MQGEVEPIAKATVHKLHMEEIGEHTNGRSAWRYFLAHPFGATSGDSHSKGFRQMCGLLRDASIGPVQELSGLAFIDVEFLGGTRDAHGDGAIPAQKGAHGERRIACD